MSLVDKEEQTIREYLISVIKAYEEMKQTISEVFRDPLTQLMNTINGMLDQILDLPCTEENWKLLREFLAVKSN